MTGPTLLQTHGLRLSAGGRDLLHGLAGAAPGEAEAEAGVSLTLVQGERAALLGRNGAGKTTLLDVLAGVRPPETGTVWQAPGLRLAYLGQHHHWAPGQTVAALLEAAHPYRALEAQARALETDLSDPARLEQWAALRERLAQAQAYSWEARARRILGQLGLGELPDLPRREAATLSGGERTRLALALVLAREPDLLLLDEPTNHLDVRMREWLEGWLRAFGGGVLLTSHDRDFLDAVAVRSLWLEGGELHLYPGGYSRAWAQRELERRTGARAARVLGHEAGRLDAAAGRLDRWGRRSRGVKSRLTRLGTVQAPLPERQVRMRLLAGDSRARLLAWGERLSVSYGGRTVLRGVRFKLRQGDRVCVLGANGTGKTTLLRLLAGEQKSDPDGAADPDNAGAGPVLRLAGGVTLAYLDQTWHGLDPERGLHAQFAARFGEQQAPALLGAAGLTRGDWAKTPRQLSGGERSRAGLALVSALRSDLLLLDEPTNHLDVEALQALEAAVQAYGGALVIVTHDRRFAREVATRLWVIEGGVLREVTGWGRTDYLDPARALQDDPPPPPPEPTPQQRMEALEDDLLDLTARLDTPWELTGREEARLRSAAHHAQVQLYSLYAEVYGAEYWDTQVPEPSAPGETLLVRGQRLGSGGGGIFWAAGQPHGPHFAWDGAVLRPSGPMTGGFGAALLGGTLRILFEHWDVGRVALGREDAPPLRRREWLARLGYPVRG